MQGATDNEVELEGYLLTFAIVTKSSGFNVHIWWPYPDWVTSQPSVPRLEHRRHGWGGRHEPLTQDLANRISGREDLSGSARGFIMPVMKLQQAAIPMQGG